MENNTLDTTENVVILITGRAGTGKTYLTEYLEKTHNIPQLVAMSNREPRKNDIGIEIIEGHKVKSFFGRLVGFQRENPEIFYLIEDMYSYFEGYKPGLLYFTTHDQYKNKGMVTYIIDYPTVAKTVENTQGSKVVSVCLSATEDKISKAFDDRDMSEEDKASRKATDDRMYSNIHVDVEINVTDEDGNYRDIKDISKELFEKVRKSLEN